MTAQNPETTEYCGECETEYLAPEPDTPCPLCPLGDTLSKAHDRAESLEPYRVISETTAFIFQKELSRLTSNGWKLEDFQVGHSQGPDCGTGVPVFIALVSRMAMRNKYKSALKRQDNAWAAMYQARRQIESAVKVARPTECPQAE